MKFFVSILPVAIALLSTSCGTDTGYVAASQPASTYDAVVVKDFVLTGEETSPNARFFTKEFTPELSQQLQGLAKFTKVVNAPYSGRALRIEGEVTYLHEGNSMMRTGVGFGTGKAHFNCTARFVDNSTGKKLGTLDVERSSRPGWIGAQDNVPYLRIEAANEIANQAGEFARNAD